MMLKDNSRFACFLCNLAQLRLISKVKGTYRLTHNSDTLQTFPTILLTINYYLISLFKIKHLLTIK